MLNTNWKNFLESIGSRIRRGSRITSPIARKPRRRRTKTGRYSGEKLEERVLLSAVSALVATQTQTAQAPVVTSPSTITSDTTPTINWTRSQFTVQSQVFVANLASGQAVINQTVSGSSYTPPSALSSGSSYRVWVRWFDARGIPSAWSQPRDFRVASQPLPAPTVTSPGASTNDMTPTIRWQGSRNAVRTQVFVADVVAGRAVINQTVSGSSYTSPSALSAGRSYRVWVRSFDAAGNASQWSKPHDFKVASEPLKTPSISSPGSTTNDTTPTIRWQGSSNAVRTQVFVADVAAGRAVINQTVSGSSYTSPSALSAGRSYPG